MSSWQGSNTSGEAPSYRRDSAQTSATDGSTAASRIPALGRSANAGYVTIGSIRYGVRFASAITGGAAAAPSRNEAPPRGDASNQHVHGADCCCGVVQLSWPRAAPSRIPLPAEKPPAINRRGIFSRINSGEVPRGGPTQQAVYRSTLEWSQQQKNVNVATSCFRVRADNDHDGVRAMQRQRDIPPTPVSPTSPTRRRILVRPKPDLPAYLKLCSSASSDSDTSYLLTPSESRAESKDNLVDTTDSPRRNTLDRFHRLRFGGGGKEKERDGTSGGRSTAAGKKKQRSSDKTERLRELTEKLKGTSSAGRKRPPPENAAEPNPPPAAARKAAVTHSQHKDVVRAEDALAHTMNDSCDKTVEDSAVAHVASDTTKLVNKEDDIFECVDLRLPKAESRTIVGSYIQRTIPFRSASFSQVDFSSTDGKYIRSNTRCSPYSSYSSANRGNVLPLSSASVIAGGSLTLPRKKLGDTAAAAVSPSSSGTLDTEEPSGSTPSVDSAVGSNESVVTSTLSRIPIVNSDIEPSNSSDVPHKQPGARSLTYPLPKRGNRSDDDIPFSSIDGNGLKSLLYVPGITGTGRELQEVLEESETSLSESGTIETQSNPNISLPGIADPSLWQDAEHSSVFQDKLHDATGYDKDVDTEVLPEEESIIKDHAYRKESIVHDLNPNCQRDIVSPETVLSDDVVNSSLESVFTNQPLEADNQNNDYNYTLNKSLLADNSVLPLCYSEELHSVEHFDNVLENSSIAHGEKCISLDTSQSEIFSKCDPTNTGKLEGELDNNACESTGETEICDINEVLLQNKSWCSGGSSDVMRTLCEENTRNEIGFCDTNEQTFITQWPKNDLSSCEGAVTEETDKPLQELSEWPVVTSTIGPDGWTTPTETLIVCDNAQHTDRASNITDTQQCESIDNTNQYTDSSQDNIHVLSLLGETADLKGINITDKQGFIDNQQVATQEMKEKTYNHDSNQWIHQGNFATSGDSGKPWPEGGRTPSEWGNITDEPQSPDTVGEAPPWPKLVDPDQRWPTRSRLVCQSSDERDDEPVKPASRRYQLLVRADSLSEGESDQGERRPATPSRDRDRTASPSLFAPSDFSDSEGRPGGGGGNTGRESRSPHTPRRYYKRPLRGPYGQMLEAEMKKPETNRISSKLQYNDDLKFFLEEYVSPPPQRPSSPVSGSAASASETGDSAAVSRGNPGRPRALTAHSLDDSQLKGGYSRFPGGSSPGSLSRSTPKRKVSANIPYSAPIPSTSSQDGNGRGVFVYHQRTTSSPSKLEGYSSSRPEETPRPEATPELLAELLRGSSEGIFVQNSSIPLIADVSALHWRDTRTHVVVELYDTERSYVESMQILVIKYLQPLKSSENAGLVDAALVDEIFYQVPAILAHHEVFLEELRKRLEQWDIKQKIGDVFLDAFTKQPIIDIYTSFINNWKSAKEAIKSTCQAKPAFARFLEAMAREHKGKLALDNLLIKPVQRIPRYELLMQRLLKHTDPSHPDHQLLLDAQQLIHDLAVKINCTERETLKLEQQQQTLKELEAHIEGLINLVASKRSFVRQDLVTMASGQGTRKERALFLFSDLLVITSIKRRSGTIRKPSTSCSGSVTSSLEANKYKLLMRIPLDDLEIVKAKDENLRRMLREMEHLAEDVATLMQMNDLRATLHCPHSQLEECLRETLNNLNKQLSDRQSSDSQLSYLELTLNTQNGIENISVVFTNPDKRNSWEESFNEAKQKLALSADRRPSPEFIAPLPIRKTRAGLQFTCAAPTLGFNAYSMRDVWVCNSDGYVGQVCILSLQPEPTVISCNGVCNARILCIASIPAGLTGSPSSCSPGQMPFTNSQTGISISVEDTDEGSGNIQLDSSSSSEDDEEGEEGNGNRQSGGVEEEQKRIRSASDSLSEATTCSLSDDMDNLQPTMWLGTEDGCIHVYNCSDNIRIKKNKVKIQHGSSVQCIIYLDNRVFVSLANGDITVYIRDHSGWNTTDPYTVSVGSAATPVTRMLPIVGKLWCSCHNSIKILNTASLQVEYSFQVNSDSSRAVTCMALSGLGVWISLQNSAIIRLFHAATYEPMCDVNVAPAVTKMLASCDDIIRQHKAACLRVTSLLACKDLLWIGTSAGVVLTMPLPHISPLMSKLTNVPSATGVPHGHTGHVRFLTYVEMVPAAGGDSLVVRPCAHHRYSLKSKPDLLSHQSTTNPNVKLLVISGGDGYEDFRTSSVSEVAGREDSTNHLLLWHV